MRHTVMVGRKRIRPEPSHGRLVRPLSDEEEAEMAEYGGMNERESVLADSLKGAVAGGIAVWVMEQVDWYMYNHEAAEARRRTQRVRPGGLDPAHVMANRVAHAVGTELSPPQPHPAGIAIHYALGVGPGALYGALQDRVPGLGAGRGALFGLGLFLMQDELAFAASGLSARPSQYPWQAHARGLVAHLIFGVVTDTLLRVLKGPGRLTKYAPEERARFRHSRSAASTAYAEDWRLDDDYQRAVPPRSPVIESARMDHVAP
jgi:hypothetical protein